MKITCDSMYAPLFKKIYLILSYLFKANSLGIIKGHIFAPIFKEDYNLGMCQSQNMRNH